MYIYIYTHIRCKFYKYICIYLFVFWANFSSFYWGMVYFSSPRFPDARFVWPIDLHNWVVLGGFHVGFHIPYKTSIWVMASLPKPTEAKPLGFPPTRGDRMLPPWKPNVNAWRGRSSAGGRP